MAQDLEINLFVNFQHLEALFIGDQLMGVRPEAGHYFSMKSVAQRSLKTP